jgi:7-cyano-7-deazaguanine synthase in queuosine biosynthesis
MAKDLAIVLNNGSVNSAVATALAAQKYRPVMLFAETGPQSAGSRLRAAYDQQVAHFKPYREHTLAMPFLSTITPTTNAAFTAAIDPRQSTALAPVMLELLPLLAVAVRFAVHYQAAGIYLGVRAGAQGEVLAQMTEYTQIWNEMIQMPCAQPDLSIEAPLLELEPWQVIDVGFQVAAPFERTWSCLEETSEPCWACRGCRARELAFQQAAKSDPMRVVRKI